MHDHGRCDHCGIKRGDLRTHLIPRSIRIGQDGKAIHEHAQSVLLCGTCGDQRRADLRAFFRGAPPTRLVCVEGPAIAGALAEIWGPPV